MTTNTQWTLKGEYFENCNCEVLCPCIVQGTGIDPTDGHCDVAFAFHITDGDFNGVSLAGLSFVAACLTPGPMEAGNWTSAFYVDERADVQQREAMEQILSGRMGSPAERWLAMTTDFKGIKYVAVDFKIEGKTRSVTIPNIISFNVEGITKRNQEDAMLLKSTGHPVNTDLYLAKGTASTYTDHGMTWDNTDRNGHYAPFDWHWP
jgi:hypothetical protein